MEIQHFVMDSTTGAPFSTVIDQSDEFLYDDLLESADVTVLIGNCHRFESLSLSAFA